MTLTPQSDQESMMYSDEEVQRFEACLRQMKGPDDYSSNGTIVGSALKTKEGERFEFDAGHTLEDAIVMIGVETDDGRRIRTLIPAPTSWDLTNDLVVLFEYLSMKPELFHELGSQGRQVPVTFDAEQETYCVDFGEMRTALVETDE